MGLNAGQEISVKCRAMYARLLNHSEYDALLSKKSVSQIADFLKKQTPYSYVLRHIDENDVHRGQLEQVFKQSLFLDYENLIKFTAGNYKAAIRAMFEAFEIDDLKLVISSICSDNEHYLIPEDLIYTNSYSKIAAPSLLRADTMAKLVENLRETRYYKSLRLYASDDKPGYIQIDHALNLLNYNAKMDTFKKTLTGALRKEAVSLLGAQSDIDNIMYIYRIKKLYRYGAKEILRYLIPCEHKLSNKKLLELAESDSIEQLAERIAKTEYAALFPKDRESEWEKLQAEHFYHIHRINIRKNGGNVSAAFSYLFLKEIDIKNIIIIIEGIRYAMPADQIVAFLVGYGDKRAA